ncbi:DUF86 domain-containing protein [Leptolyngbyaceae cyanobacterium UHCC 1019]
MRSDRERLQDTLEAINQIERYAIQGQAEFLQDELIQIWIVHHLQIIGESSNSLSDALVDQHSEVPWAAIVEFRNILVHEYFRVNLEIVWKIVEQDLPNLKVNIETILQETL